MKQEKEEWVEYKDVMEEVIESSGLNEKIFYDLRGNHDSFGVPETGNSYDFYDQYSINANLGRKGKVQSITLKNRGWKHLFVGFDSTSDVGLRGPTNLFGHPNDELLSDIEMELSQWDSESSESSVTKVSFGHFPLSFSALSESGRSLRDVFLKHSLSAYICGHLHTRFGKNLKRHHQSGLDFQSTGRYFQYNMHQGTSNNFDVKNFSSNSGPVGEFWEWEMGDWRKSRSLRILAIDSGHLSFTDIDLISGSKETIIVPTFPLESMFMQRISYLWDHQCRSAIPSSYDTARALVFSKTEISSVVLKIYDNRPGKLYLVFDSVMRRLKGNHTRGDLYAAPWNWRAFVDPEPDRYWVQIEAVDILGRTSFSTLRPLSINGIAANVDWKFKEFWVMGCQWASLYHPIFWSVMASLFALLLVPPAFHIFSKNQYGYNDLVLSLARGNIIKFPAAAAFWILLELSRMKLLWFDLLAYLLLLIARPWFSGNVFTEIESSGATARMTYNGWILEKDHPSKQPYIGDPDVMVVVLPHLILVVLPTIIILASFCAEKSAYTSYLLSLSKREYSPNEQSGGRVSNGRYYRLSALILSRRWLRKLLLLGVLVVLWKHSKSCRMLMKAYDMNPFMDSAVHCFFLPLWMVYTIIVTK